MSWEKPASPSAALLFVALIKVYTGNLGNELRNKPQPVSLVHLCNGVLRNHRENAKTWHGTDVILYMHPCVSLIAFLSLVFSLRYLVSQLLKAQGWFGERILVGFQKDWNTKSCSVYNHGKFLFSNLTRLEDFMLYFIV